MVICAECPQACILLEASPESAWAALLANPNSVARSGQAWDIRLREWAAEGEEIHASSKQRSEQHENPQSEAQLLRAKLGQWEVERLPQLKAK